MRFRLFATLIFFCRSVRYVVVVLQRPRTSTIKTDRRSLGWSGKTGNYKKLVFMFFMFHRKPNVIFFGKYLFGRRFEIQNFRNICCKISCLLASPRIFEHLKKGVIAHFFTDFYPKNVSWNQFGSLFLAEIFAKVSFDSYNVRITRLSARKSEHMKNF